MRRLPFLVALALVVLLAGCGSEPATPIVLTIEPTVPPWQITVQSDPYPQIVGAATLIVTVTTGEDSAPVTGLALSARGDMSHAGMAPVLSEGVEGDPGVYRVPWEWTMAGDWQIEFTLRSADGGEVAQRIDVRVES